MGTICGSVANVRFILDSSCAAVETLECCHKFLNKKTGRMHLCQECVKESPVHGQDVCLLIHRYSTAAKYVKVISHHSADMSLTQNQLC